MYFCPTTAMLWWVAMRWFTRAETVSGRAFAVRGCVSILGFAIWFVV